MGTEKIPISLGGNKSVRDVIIEILSKEWPLSLKVLYNSVRSRGHSVSYQAVHKTVKQLIEKGIIEKLDERKYQLKINWIKDVVDFSSRLRERYEDDMKYELAERVSGIKNAGKNRMFLVQIMDNMEKYFFSHDSMLVEKIPSVFISKSTLSDIVRLMPESQLNELIKLIAKKDLEYIQNHMGASGGTDALNMLNRLSKEFYWGSNKIRSENGTVIVEIGSNCYVSKKEITFFEDIYIEFMRLLGYKLKKRDTLTKTLYFRK